MDAELVEYHRQGKLSAMELGQLKLKHKALRDQISSQRQEIARGEQRMRRLHMDIYACMQHLQDPKRLKAGVTALYRKHLSSELRPAEVNTDILKEQTRQRDYLEKAVECLKKRLGKDAETHRQDNVKLMQENAALICEINDLRKEVFALHSERRQLKLTRGSKRLKDTKQGKGREGSKGGGGPPLSSAAGGGEPHPNPGAAASAQQPVTTGHDAAQGDQTTSTLNSVLKEKELINETQDTNNVAEECAKLIATQASEIAALKEKLKDVEKQLEGKDTKIRNQQPSVSTAND
ncbi:hypothetical protein Emed_002710 [Eimeria media]